MLFEPSELDILLNTLETSSLEPHEEETMEFTNHEQKVIYDYIKELEKKVKELKKAIDK